MIWIHDEKIHAVSQNKVDTAHALIDKWKNCSEVGCCIAHHALEIMRILGLEGGDFVEATKKT